MKIKGLIPFEKLRFERREVNKCLSMLIFLSRSECNFRSFFYSSCRVLFTETLLLIEFGDCSCENGGQSLFPGTTAFS